MATDSFFTMSNVADSRFAKAHGALVSATVWASLLRATIILSPTTREAERCKGTSINALVSIPKTWTC